MSTVGPDRSHNWFVRAATVIGDLSNPFYREERQRDVWNEASAVALQVVLWLSLLAATVAVWVVGADALPYVNTLMVIIGVASWIAFLYAWNLGVNAETSRARWPRLALLGVVVVLLLAGMLRASAVGSLVDDWSSIAGMVTGFAVVAVLFTVTARLARRRAGSGQGD
jgi:lysylphosphatidylglycerol synthetase-like protein (DUF2156 family)